MIPLLTPAEMRTADAAAAESVGTVALMRAAGRRVAEYIENTTPPGRVVAFAGPGNNGGDAFAAFAELPSAYERTIYADEVQPSEARADAQSRARTAGVGTAPLPQSESEARDALRGATLVLDALFGTGARLPVDDRYAAAVAAMNACEAHVIAVDIPTGVDAESGAIVEPAVRASATVTLGAVKVGLLLEPARACAGKLWLAEIGIDAAAASGNARHFVTLDDDAFLKLLPVRRRDADKRTAGAPLVLAGSEQFPGAAVLCARAAARAGAGYVTVATAAKAAPLLRAHLVEQVVVALPDGEPDAVAAGLLDVARHNTSVAIGPGLALDDRTGETVRAFVRKLDLPFVLDASALFHFAKHLDLLSGKRCVVTPHAGEFARLSGKGNVAAGTRVERLHEFVTRTGVTTLLKGPGTLVFDGATTYINPTGTNALATAGTGDVLTGIIATLLAQGLPPFEAACAGAYWHGLAALRAHAERSRGVVAGDLPDLLADALPPPHEGAQLILIDNRDA